MMSDHMLWALVVLTFSLSAVGWWRVITDRPKLLTGMIFIVGSVVGIWGAWFA